MKYRFVVEGENKEHLEKLQEKMMRSKFFKDAKSGMVIGAIEEEKK